MKVHSSLVIPSPSRVTSTLIFRSPLSAVRTANARHRQRASVVGGRRLRGSGNPQPRGGRVFRRIGEAGEGSFQAQGREMAGIPPDPGGFPPDPCADVTGNDI
ncbi:hypothetical protein E2562_022703 [Oryza meyeriana var. granulata]|uniref:Uncharacterized protein n=1 Tax=Oryza meyeriana var. granulata TaxID=110450 RepID=A0A6G1E095_9ORYZ|nr:hypothetical protein E2562_022703 [Oryza meyeriana var. granulata]